MWDGVFAEFRPGFASSEAEIARAEAELGFRLPDSYRSFCGACGAGRTNDHFRIATPLPYEAADLVTRANLIALSVSAAIRALAANPDLADQPVRFDIEGGDEAILERACFFGEGDDGAFLFWDVQGTGEYDIWVMGADLESIRFGGETLLEFVQATQGPRIHTVLGPTALPLPSRFEGIDAATLARAGLPD
ncbi:SMI1/KNR4 family protein [Methylobacterium planeticum]|uniref:SMI1/KNR4 family protein n=1 Tax=Methylobacterium planeticum TaxID=2615211 RepID=A0A6N6MR87_9HYPH|nr:SMI1/KNR4 family protein [Methylobacterium planeticum]KAB1071962.1 SMI1/KNR4 family protein [Methylobacterium planeticum]